MPHEKENFEGHLATVTGWGAVRYGGSLAPILQKVEVNMLCNREIAF